MTRKSLTAMIMMFWLLVMAQVAGANLATWAKEISLENGAVTYGTNYAFTPVASTETADGGTLTVGSFRGIKLIGGEYKRLFALRSDSLGNHLWCKWYNLTASNYQNSFYDCTQLPNGNFVIVGKRAWASGAGNGIMLEIDSNGNIQTSLGFPGAYVFRGIKTTSDGGLILAGMEGYYNNTYPVVYKLSSNFTVEWKSVIQNSSALVISNSICEVAGEGYFLATTYSGIIKLNFDGTAEWRKTFANNGRTLRDSSVYALSDGDLMTTGSYYIYTYYGSLNRIDADGFPVWTKCSYLKKAGSIRTFTETPSGDFVIGGATYYPNSMMWFSRLYSDGSTDWIRSYTNTYGVPFHFSKVTEDAIFAVGGSDVGALKKVFNVKADSTGAVAQGSAFLFEQDPADFELITYEGTTTTVVTYPIVGLIDLETAPLNANISLAVTAETVTMETTLACETKANLEVQFDDTEGEKIEGRLISDSSIVIDCGDGVNLCSEEFSDGTQVELTATPQAGYVFDYWDDGNGNAVSNNPMTVTVTDDVVWTAVFEEIPTQSPIRPVSGGSTLEQGDTPAWSPTIPHNGVDYSSSLAGEVKSVGKGTVYGVGSYTKPTSGSFGSIHPDGDGDGPTIWIKHTLANGNPIYVLYGHTASSWTDNTVMSPFDFDCSYAISWANNASVEAGEAIGLTAPFYNGGISMPHLHLSVFLPNQAGDGSFYGPPSTGWGYSEIVLTTGEYIDPEVFFSDYQLNNE